MSQFIASVKEIKKEGNLNIVKFDFMGEILSMMSLELSKDIDVGSKVILGVKPTHIAIGKEFLGVVSYSNQLSAVIKKIDKGKLLASIDAEAYSCLFESIITADSAKRMDLKIEDTITLFIKASELFIVEICHD